MPDAPLPPIATLGIDIGKNSFHLIGLDARRAIVLRQKLPRGQIEARLANIPTRLIGTEAGVAAHHLSRGRDWRYSGTSGPGQEPIFPALSECPVR